MSPTLRPWSLAALIGVAGTLALSRWIQGLLFGITATDPGTLASVVVTLLVVAALACYIPARRAVRMNPIVALRRE